MQIVKYQDKLFTYKIYLHPLLVHPIPTLSPTQAKGTIIFQLLFLSRSWHLCSQEIGRGLIRSLILCVLFLIILTLCIANQLKLLYILTRGPWAFTLCLRTNLAMGQGSKSCTYTLFLAQGRVKLSFFFALRAVVSVIKADFQNCPIWA